MICLISERIQLLFYTLDVCKDLDQWTNPIGRGWVSSLPPGGSRSYKQTWQLTGIRNMTKQSIHPLSGKNVWNLFFRQIFHPGTYLRTKYDDFWKHLLFFLFFVIDWNIYKYEPYIRMRKCDLGCNFQVQSLSWTYCLCSNVLLKRFFCIKSPFNVIQCWVSFEDEIKF